MSDVNIMNVVSVKKLVTPCLFLIFFLIGCAHQKPRIEPYNEPHNKSHNEQCEFHCEGEVFHLPHQKISGKQEKYLAHSGAQKFDNYVSLNLNYQPFQILFTELNQKFGGLKNRGEAHVTVITPVEYNEILKANISIEELHALAAKMNLQKSEVKAICLGKGEKAELGATYYVVVESKDLLQFREKVLAAYLLKGGSPRHFAPEHFYPHITIGFNLRDLHESDGVKKDRNSCLFSPLGDLVFNEK